MTERAGTETVDDIECVPLADGDTARDPVTDGELDTVTHPDSFPALETDGETVPETLAESWPSQSRTQRRSRTRIANRSHRCRWRSDAG